MSFGLTAFVFSVGQLTRHIRERLESDSTLADVWVEGEVSNFQRSGAGHVYFTLKDEGAAISCVAWRSVVGRWTHLPQDGHAILAHGHVSVYEVQGRYQLYVDQVEPAGLGRLYLEFQALKERLGTEGLFAPERKRPLPAFPQVVGIVTSPQAAALQDILRVLRSRFPAVEVVLAPTLVQGDAAPEEIVRALRAVDRLPEVDVILLARGGGSLEELWAFNTERVARAVAACQHPVVTGIGHEVDFTIADFVADYRAPTPSAAASAIVPDGQELMREIWEKRRRLGTLIWAQLQQERGDLEAIQRALRSKSPLVQVEQRRQGVDELERRLGGQIWHQLDISKREVAGWESRLRGADPMAVLRRGYALVTKEDDGSLVRSVQQVCPGEAIKVRVVDGQFGASVGPGREPE